MNHRLKRNGIKVILIKFLSLIYTRSNKSLFHHSYTGHICTPELEAKDQKETIDPDL